MKKAEIKVGGLYKAKVSGNIVTVRVDRINERDGFNAGKATFDVTNLTTGRKTTFRSAAKFRCEAKPDKPSTTLDQKIQEALETAEETTIEKTEKEEASEEADPTQSAPYAHTTAGGAEARTSLGPIARAISSIAQEMIGRQVGTPVAGMIPNQEQESILAVAIEKELKVLVVGAGAGTGKTATLKMLEQVLPGRGQYTAFNTALVAESKAKFVKASCNTTHSLAFHAVGKKYQHRLNGERMRSAQIARILGIEAIKLEMEGEVDSEGKPRIKTLSAEFLAGQVLVAIRKFCQSADREINTNHLRYIDGIDGSVQYVGPDGETKTKHGRENNDRVKNYLLPKCKLAWQDLTSLNGSLPFGHDVYVKLWQLGTGNDRPIIAADYILLDEAQDTAPVFLDILQQQKHALLVLVGDDNQQIYEWRGAVNAMSSFKGAPRRLLSQSYRFGQTVADVANTVLATLEEPTDLVMKGNPAIPSRVAPCSEPRCYLYRTNAGAVGRVMLAIQSGKRPHLIGGGADVVAWCEAAIDLQAKRGTRHPELCCFETWSEVVTYSKTDEGQDMRLMVKLIEEFGAEEIRDALKDMPKEKDADLVISTAHKSKGREWDTVKLGPDFPTANKMADSDRRLLYVAVTRAKLTLDITDCPPFCGGESTIWGEGGSESRWIPGLDINYTVPMPTEEAAQKVKVTVTTLPGTNKSTVATDAKVVPNGNGNGTVTKYTWTNHGGNWCVRGPKGSTIGTQVTVERKDGSTTTTTIRRVVKQYEDAWIYGV